MDPNCPWNPKPKLPRGDASADILYAAVGRALSQWEQLETNLALCFSAFVGASLKDGAVLAYGTVTAFTGRRDMVKVAFEAFPARSHEKIAPFKDILNRAGNFSARRNEIAHGIVTRLTVEQVDNGCYLLPPLYNTNKQRKFAVTAGFGDYAYTSSQISEYTQHFGDLANETGSLFAAARSILDSYKAGG